MILTWITDHPKAGTYPHCLTRQQADRDYLLLRRFDFSHKQASSKHENLGTSPKREGPREGERREASERETSGNGAGIEAYEVGLKYETFLCYAKIERKSTASIRTRCNIARSVAACTLLKNNLKLTGQVLLRHKHKLR